MLHIRLKLTYLMAGLMAALCLTACTADDSDYGGSTEPAGVADSVYIHLRIAMQADPLTRAVNDHGAAEEYEVKNGMLILFKSAANKGEDEAIVTIAYTFDELGITGHFQDDAMSSVTQSANIVTSIAREAIPKNPDEKLYALVLVNYEGNSGFSVDVDDHILKYDDVDQTGKHLADLQTITLSSFNANGFYMANAPMSDGSNVTTLVQVAKIFVSEEQAKNSDATMVFVERAAAKIIVNDETAGKDTGITVDGNAANIARVHQVSWAVDRYNTSFYALRDNGGSPLCDTNLFEGISRAMWAKDVHFDDAPENVGTYEYRQPGTSVYVAEHTVNNTNANYATSIVIKLRLKDASNVIISKSGQQLYGNTGAPTQLFTTAAKRDAYVTAKGLDADNNIAYDNGELYYRRNIQQDTGYLGVVRDNVYRLTVKSFGQIGAATAATATAPVPAHAP